MLGTEMRVRVTLLEEMLGTLPGDKEVFRSYIASKAPDASTIEEEVEAIGVDQYCEKGMTVFARDTDGSPIVYDYLIKGFFKNACSALREVDGSESKKLKAYKKKIDNLVFIDERKIKINFGGKEPDIGICERPLRASTAQGERVALACSESVPAGCYLEFTIRVLSKDMMDYVIEWLDYGRFNGLGCWHNSGKGKFTWTEIYSQQ